MLVKLFFFRYQFELDLFLLHGLFDLELDEFVVYHMQDLVAHGVVWVIEAEYKGSFTNPVFFLVIIIFYSFVDQGRQVPFVT